MGPGRYNSIGQTPKTAGDAALGGQAHSNTKVGQRKGPGRCISTNNTPRLPLRSQGDKTSEIRFDTAGATTCTSKKRSENAGIRKIFRLNRYQASTGPAHLHSWNCHDCAIWLTRAGVTAIQFQTAVCDGEHQKFHPQKHGKYHPEWCEIVKIVLKA